MALGPFRSQVLRYQGVRHGSGIAIVQVDEQARDECATVKDCRAHFIATRGRNGLKRYPVFEAACIRRRV